MKPLYTQEEFDIAKKTDMLPCECYYCHGVFLKKKQAILRIGTSPIYENTVQYCSLQCSFDIRKTKVLLNCLQCGKEFYKFRTQIKKSPNHFCTKSCAGTYSSAHKMKGNRRSKLEQYIEAELLNIYEFEMLFNSKKIINSELDIYIPSLKIAFEINGIFHYKPIYGDVKYNKIRLNDDKKVKLCVDNNIQLYIIDASKQVNFTEKNSLEYLSIITNIIEQHVVLETTTFRLEI